MFIRLKKLKGKDYAYLVKNSWTKNGPRQKTKKYLGRCAILQKEKDFDFKEHYKLNTAEMNIEKYVQANDVKTILSRMFEFELLKLGFTYDKNVLVKESMIAIPKRLKIMDKENKNNIIIKTGDGFISEFMAKKILKFQFKGNEEDGKKFAEAFIAAGINVDKEIFIELYRKITNQ
jgi:hypothetical protein